MKQKETHRHRGQMRLSRGEGAEEGQTGSSGGADANDYAESGSTARSHSRAYCTLTDALPCWLSGQEAAYKADDAGDTGLTPGSERSPGGGHDNPLLYPCLENPTDRGAWWATAHRVAKTQTRLK